MALEKPQDVDDQSKYFLSSLYSLTYHLLFTIIMITLDCFGIGFRTFIRLMSFRAFIGLMRAFKGIALIEVSQDILL